MPAQLPPALDRALRLARVDFAPAHRQPAAMRVILASVLSVIGSLAADALLVVIGQAVFPSTKGYGHFQFSDYAKLTVIGVIIACAAWPIVTRISSSPRWLFFRLAILVTLVLWLPDLFILYRGAPAPRRGGADRHAPGHRRGHLQLPGAHREGEPAERPFGDGHARPPGSDPDRYAGR